MRSFIAEGKLRGDTRVWCSGMKDWARTSDIKPFKSNFTTPHAPPAEKLAPPKEKPTPVTPPELKGGGRGKLIAGVVSVVVVVVGVVAAVLLMGGGGGGGTPSSQTQASFSVDSITYEKGFDIAPSNPTLSGYYVKATVTVSNTGNQSDSLNNVNVELGTLAGGTHVFNIAANEYLNFGTIQPGGTATKTTDKLELSAYSTLSATDQFAITVSGASGTGAYLYQTTVSIGTLVV